MSQPAAGNDQQLVASPQKRKRKSNALALTPGQDYALVENDISRRRGRVSQPGL